MSDLFLSVLITFGILTAMFAFVPMLDFCGPRCQRLFLRTTPAQQQTESESLREAA